MNFPFSNRSVPKLVFVVFIIVMVIGAFVGLQDFSATTSQTSRNANAGGGYNLSPVGSNLGSGAPASYNPGPSSQPIAGTTYSQVTTVVSAATQTFTSSSSPGPSTYPLNTNQGGTTTFGAENSPPVQNSSSGMIEFFSNVTLSVNSSQSALSRATEIAYSYGGYLAYSSYSNISSTAILRIPAANYPKALSEIEGLGNLSSFSSNSNDVSIQYTDLNATLQSLLTEQASLLKLENSSNSLNDTLILEGQIQSVDAQINEIESQILQTQVLVDYSTITVTFNVVVPGPAPTPLKMKLTATPRSGLNPLSVTFNAIVTGGTQPYIINYNFGDGTTYQGSSLIHTFTSTGTYNVTVTATDTLGNVIENYTIIGVKAPAVSIGVTSFGSYALGLLVSVVEGIIVVAVVVLPIVLVIGAVIFPFRNRLRARRTEIKS